MHKYDAQAHAWLNLTPWLGAAIRRMREERGLGQRELACRAGISQGALSKIESGRLGVTWPRLARLCAVLDKMPSEVAAAAETASWAAEAARLNSQEPGT